MDKDGAIPTTPAERMVAQHVIKKLMAENKEGEVLHLPTRGQVLSKRLI